MNGRDPFQTGLDFGRSGSGSLLLIAAILFIGIGASAAATNTLSDAESQGRALAQQLCESRPAENFTNAGVLKIKDGKGKRSEIPVRFQTSVTSTNWQSFYVTCLTNQAEMLRIVHVADQLNEYFYRTNSSGRVPALDGVSVLGHLFRSQSLSGAELMTAFAGSDFWLADLGLEFFHWPGQKLLKKEVKRSRGCAVLESTNPDPSTDGYSRVVSWIDSESGGIVQAEAYDFKNQLLKEFAPKSFKKVNGQWELQEMEIYNNRTGSRTRLDFDLKP